jgi:hypothetical protein
MEVEELVATVRRNVAEMRKALAKEESFLAELEARVSGVPAKAPLPPEPSGPPGSWSGGVVPGAVFPPDDTPPRRISRKEKAALVRAMIEERRGRWLIAQVRNALRAQGVDPDAGTPIKNILYSFVHDDHWGTALGGGEYDFPDPFPEPARNGAVPSQEGLSV